MLDRTFAEHFATGWIASWNSHDLVRIMSHYTDDFEMSSPKIMALANEPSGILKGKAAIGEYWSRALQLVPNLHFEHIATYIGVSSITIHYHGVSGPGAEVFMFNEEGKVTKAFAHYL